MIENSHYLLWLLGLIGIGISKSNWIRRNLIFTYLVVNRAFLKDDLSLNLGSFHSSWEWGFKLAAVWSSNEGSLFLAIFIIALLVSSKLSQLSTMLVCHAYLGFVINPLLKRGEILVENQEFSTLLQDSLLLIHPPCLYLGFLTLIRPFLRYFQFLKTNQLELNSLKKELAFSSFFSTLGLGLGSWWAYHELGRGGYRFRDPVENLALIQVILSLIAFHLIVKEQRLKALLFSSLTFFFVFSSTLTIRSGILNSVHSFTLNTTWILGLIGLCIGIRLLRSLMEIPKEFYPSFPYLNSTQLLYGGGLLAVVMCSILRIGTYLPLIEKVSIGSVYFKEKLRPRLTSLLVLFYLMKKGSNSLKEVSSYGGGNWLIFRNYLPDMNYQSTILVLFSTLILLNLIKKRKEVKLSYLIGHLSLMVRLIGVGVQTSLEIVEIFPFESEERRNLKGFNLDLLYIQEKETPNCRILEPILALTSSSGTYLGELNPSWVYYPFKSELILKTASLSNGIIDWFIYFQKDELCIGYQPALSLIWISLILFLFSLILNVLEEKKGK